MINVEHLHLEAPENRFVFEKRLSQFDHDSRRGIMFAYDVSKAAHRSQKRDQGERYFEHPRAVALILLDEVHITNPHIIAAALLHDIPEDTAVFGNPYALRDDSSNEITKQRQIKYSEWMEDVYINIAKSFSPETAEIVVAVTKPKPDGSELPIKIAAKEKYINDLKQATPEAILVKMADRLHNLRTLPFTTPEKQMRKVAETEEIYLPIFEQAQAAYPKETAYMLQEIKKSIKIVQDSNNSNNKS